MPRTLAAHPHAQFLQKQFQQAVQGLNRKYAGKLTPAQMAQMQMGGTDIQSGAGLATRSLAPLAGPQQRELSL